MDKPVFSIIVPVFNEEEVLDELYKRLGAVMRDTGQDYEIIFINDGSKDGSLDILKRIIKNDRRIKIIDLSRNFGHQIAISAGIDHASGDAAVIIDGDLQDPPEVIPRFIEKWREGFEVVYGTRIKREGENWFKLATAAFFYRLIKKIARIDMPLDAGDFRLIDRKVIDSLKEIKERNRFVRGLVSWVGFRQTGVPYQREKRFAGKTKYHLWKMVRFAFDAITSFSLLPLRIATFMGFSVFFICLIYIVKVMCIRIFTDKAVPGWSSLMVAVVFLGGIQLITIGIIGEYIGRIGEEAKKRPLYIVREVMK